MSHFAEIDPNTNKVLRVIVAEQDFIDSGAVGDPKNWIQTSYNTYHGINERTGLAIRKNFAGIGYTYDEIKDAFIPPKPYNSWILNEETCDWESPTSYPNDGKTYSWNEENTEWVEIIE